MTQSQDGKTIVYLHVRPGLDEGKRKHPIATLALDISGVSEGILAIGYAMRHSGKDSWDAALGRKVAAGRARKSLTHRVCTNVDPTSSRRQLLLEAVVAIYEASRAERIPSTRRFQKALFDMMVRMSSERRALSQPNVDDDTDTDVNSQNDVLEHLKSDVLPLDALNVHPF